MRSHGDTGQADPTIDANKVIHIVMLPSVPGGVSGSSGQGSGPGQYCGSYLTAASTALRGGQPAPSPPSHTQLVKYAECMRAHGIAGFPDPTAAGFQLPSGSGGDLSPGNPTMEAAANACQKSTGVQPVGGGGSLPPGSIESGPPGGSQGAVVPVSGGGAGANG